MRGVGSALRFDNRSPLRSIPSVRALLALLPKRLVNALHFVIATRLSRVKEPLEFIRNRDFEVRGHSPGELATAASELRDFAGDNFLGCGRQLYVGLRVGEAL